MLHIKLQGNRLIGSEEVESLGFLSYKGIAAILVARPELSNTFYTYLPGSCIRNLICLVVLGKC